MNAATEPQRVHCNPTAWNRQFMRPDGWFGRMIGRLMARKNGAQTLTGVKLFDVQPTDHILEIGFGPGVGIEAFAARAVNGRVCGVDWSAMMVDLASRRTRRAVAAGRVELRQGAADALPYPDATFDKVFEANSFHIWPDRDAALSEIHRVLKPGGEFMLCLRLRHPSRTKYVAPGHAPEDIPRIAALLERIGFATVRDDVRELGRTIHYLVVRKRD